MKIRQFVVAFSLLLTPLAAHAQLGCWVGMGSINFGNVNQVGGGDTNSNGTMSLSCAGATQPFVRVCIGLGATVDSSWNPRYLIGQQTGGRLAYNIYMDAAYTQIWGNEYSVAGPPRAVDLPMSYGSGYTTVPYYAKVPAQSGALSDTYNTTFTYASDTSVRVLEYSGTPPACSSSMPMVSRFEFGVWATVQGDCSITASSLDFGAAGLELSRTATDAVSTITMRCTQGTAYTIALDAGTGSGATVSERRMTRDAGPETLRYSLYRDSARTQVWGDGSAGTVMQSGTGTGTQNSINHSVYGRLVPQAEPPTGTYHDTITATVTF